MHTYIYIYKCIQIYIYTCAWVCMCVCERACVHACVCVCISYIASASIIQINSIKQVAQSPNV